jgi:cobalamin biosynthesis protein CobT
MRNNVDGECVEIAGRRLLARREKGKILMVLSDGAPSCFGDTKTLAAHLKKVVDNISKAGVNVIGIGIESTEVRRFYPKSLVLNNVSELPVVVMKELRALIVK